MYLIIIHEKSVVLKVYAMHMQYLLFSILIKKKIIFLYYRINFKLFFYINVLRTRIKFFLILAFV